MLPLPDYPGLFLGSILHNLGKRMHRYTRNTLAGLFLSLSGGLVQASLEQAQQAIQAGDHRTAEQTLLRLIGTQPTQPEAYNNLAVMYAGQGRMDEARELLEQAMRTHPSYATVYDNLTRITVEMSRNSYARALRLQGNQAGMDLIALRVQPGAQAELAVVTASAGSQPETLASNPPQADIEAAAEPAAVVVSEPVPTAPTSTTIAERAATAGLETNAQPEAVNQPVITEVLTEIGPNEEIEAVLNNWAAAWSGQDVEGYLDAYSERFVPTGTQTLAQWEAQRRQRLSRPERIEVALSEIEVLLFDARRARARVVQAYRSDRYSDVTRKEFQMVNEGGRWLITSERSIEVLQR